MGVFWAVPLFIPMMVACAAALDYSKLLYSLRFFKISRLLIFLWSLLWATGLEARSQLAPPWTCRPSRRPGWRGSPWGSETPPHRKEGQTWAGTSEPSQQQCTSCASIPAPCCARGHWGGNSGPLSQENGPSLQETSPWPCKAAESVHRTRLMAEPSPRRGTTRRGFGARWDRSWSGFSRGAKLCTLRIQCFQTGKCHLVSWQAERACLC